MTRPAAVLAPRRQGQPFPELSATIDATARRAGVDLVGFGDVIEALPADFDHLPVGVSLGVVDPVMRLLTERGRVGAHVVERALYDHRDLESQRILEEALRRLADLLQSRGYRYFCFPPDCDPMESPFTSLLARRFSHKAAATCAGLGWVGRHGLLNHRAYGPQVAWATLVTDAPLDTAEPVVTSACGVCRACVEACPGGAISGRSWRREDGMTALVDVDRCRYVLDENERVYGRRICGRCAVACAMGKLPFAAAGAGSSLPGAL